MATAKRIRPLLGVATDAKVARDLEAHVERVLPDRSPHYLTAEELDRILRWKLRDQYARQHALRAQNTEAVVRAVTAAALSIRHDDADDEVELKVAILTGLRGVGVPVASAILAGTDEAFSAYQATRDVFAGEFLDLSDEIASFDWDFERIKVLHHRLSGLMGREEDLIRSLDGVGRLAEGRGLSEHRTLRPMTNSGSAAPWVR